MAPGTDDSPPFGVWIGVDVGTARVGVARSDPRGTLAVPVETLARDKRRDRDLDRLAAVVAEYDAVGVVIGLPVTLAGRQGRSAAMARAYGSGLSRRIAPVPVRFVDERLSTVSATRRLTERGVSARDSRSIIDQAAAVEILQLFLDSARSVAPGSTPKDDDPARRPAHRDAGRYTDTARHPNTCGDEPHRRT